MKGRACGTAELCEREHVKNWIRHEAHEAAGGRLNKFRRNPTHPSVVWRRRRRAAAGLGHQSVSGSDAPLGSRGFNTGAKNIRNEKRGGQIVSTSMNGALA